MAEIRQGYFDDYTQITNGNIGIGTSVSNEKLEIIGGVTSQELNVTGIATFTYVSGLIRKHTNYSENADMTAGDSGTLSGEIVVGAGLTMTVGAAATSSQGSVDSLKVYNMFQPPSGTTNQRPPAKTGAIFYNFDFKTIEFFDGNSWNQVDNVTRGTRGVIGGGFDTAQPANVASIEVVNISSRGNAVDFGTVNKVTYSQAGSASAIRGIINGASGYSDDIEYITIASGGAGIDFGNLSVSRSSHMAACNSSTRSVFSGGYVSPGASSNTLDYIEIMTLGNALDFGDLVEPRYGLTSFSSPVRGVCAGGRDHPAGESPLGTRMIDFFVISSKGNAVRFGDLLSKHSYMSSTGNSTRGVIGAGTNTPSSLLSFISIASEGNSTFFGDLNNAGAGFHQGNCSSSTRGLFAGGGSPSKVNTIDAITIQSAGNAIDWGDLSVKRGYPFGLSDSNGGLGGF